MKNARRALLFITAGFAVAFATGRSIAVEPVEAEQSAPTVVHLDFDAPASQAAESLGLRVRIVDAERTTDNPGSLMAPTERENKTGLRFDGRASIVYADLPSNAPGFSENFTWEGFFLSPSSNKYLTETGIADRLVSQFANDKGDWTRFAVGLVADEKRDSALLCVELEGTEGRTFGRGTVEVTPDCWHHFAVVHEGTAGAAQVTWYLDYQPCGEVFLGGQANLNRLKPAGSAPLTIGARLREGNRVNRGFEGLIDEVRLTPRPLRPNQFLRALEKPVDRQVAVDYFDTLPADFAWEFADLESTETLRHEALAFVGMPQRFSHRGFRIRRDGRQALRGNVRLTLPKGTYRFLLRTRSEAMLSVDGRVLVDARVAVGDHPRTTKPPLGERVDQDFFGETTLDGKPHKFTLTASYLAGPENELGDVVVCYALEDGVWQLLTSADQERLTPTTWAVYRGRTQQYVRSLSDERRQAARERGEAFWMRRHEMARRAAAGWNLADPPRGGQPVDAFIDERLAALKIQPAPLADNAAFLRRLSLDVRGRIPSLAEVESFLSDSRSDKRLQMIDRLLDSDEWADHWVGYWQDVLAENPSLVYPTLNNSGAFRQWIYESFRANMPFDRFATELIQMEGSDVEGGTTGFAMASKNDAPMAMKSYVVMKAFLAVDMKCARCHDSPFDEFQQEHLFNLAAMLNDDLLAVPATSVVAALPIADGRESAVTTSLKAEQQVAPVWPRIVLGTANDRLFEDQNATIAMRPRARLASIVTSPRDSRFSDVIVNRVWKRYMGAGLVEPSDNWNGEPEPSHPELLHYLSHYFVDSGYDLKSLARLILTSQAYQRAVRNDRAHEVVRSSAETAKDAANRIAKNTFAAQYPRRMSAEQLVDSLFLAVGKQFGGESLSLSATDAGAVNLPTPVRCWQFAALPNERGRPALSMPVNQTIVDVLRTFGWNGNRQQPVSQRDDTTTALQPLILFNGLMSQRIVCLSEDSAVTELCLQELTVDELVEKLCLTVLSRRPDEGEQQALAGLLRAGFVDRRTGKLKAKMEPLAQFQPDWRNHLQPEQTRLALQAQARVRRGEQPTVRLTVDFRQRVEDVLWALVNSPEFVFMP